MKQTPSGFGKNNFDRLEAAGLVAGEDDRDSLRAKTEARTKALEELDTKVKKVEIFLASLYVMPRDQQLRRLQSTTARLKELLAQKLPVGAKRHIEACFNEVQSLLEGVASTNSRLDKQTLALTASAKARTEIQSMIQAGVNRLEKVQADSNDGFDMEDFYRKAGEVIKRTQQESHKLAPIADKPFVVARVPVATIDGGINAAKLSQVGFKAESISGYPVIHNQLVLGINPKKTGGGDDVQKYADMTKALKENGVNADDIRRLENRIAGYDRDIKKTKAELEEIDETKHKAHKEKQEAEVKRMEEKRTELVNEMQSLIERGGIDYEAYLKLGQRMRREDTAATGNIEVEARRIIKSLEKQMRLKAGTLAMIGKPRRYQNGVWFWLMPEHEVNLLAKASFSKRAAVQQWGFAFQ